MSTENESRITFWQAWQRFNFVRKLCEILLAPVVFCVGFYCGLNFMHQRMSQHYNEIVKEQQEYLDKFKQAARNTLDEKEQLERQLEAARQIPD